MVYYNIVKKRGLKKGTVRKIRIVSYIVAATALLTGGVLTAISEKYLTPAAVTLIAALILFVATAAITDFIEKTGADRREVVWALTITDKDIHGITNGVIYTIPLNDIIEIYTSKTKAFGKSLIIRSRLNVYEFDTLRNPELAVKAFETAKHGN